MDKIKNWMINHKKLCLYAVGAVVVIAIGFLVWHLAHPPQTVTTESQQEAQTPAGIQQAANKAFVPISNDQSKEAAEQIRYIYANNTPPQYITYTTVQQAPDAEKIAQEKAGADFSIVTDATAPAKKADISSLPANAPVTLNQYNVQAYKKVLHTVDVGTSDAKSVGEVGYTVSKKISKDGKYIGVGASYNFDNEKAMVKLSYTW